MTVFKGWEAEKEEFFMTKAKLFALIRFYEADANRQTGLPPNRFPKNRVLSEQFAGEAISHALVMLREVAGKLRSGKMDVNHAYGEMRAIQTIFWMASLYTEEEIESHMKNDV